MAVFSLFTAIWNIIKSIWSWFITGLTFKKAIVVYCLVAILVLSIYALWCDFNGHYYNSEVVLRLITVHVGELALTTINSLDILKKDSDICKEINPEDENYG